MERLMSKKHSKYFIWIFTFLHSKESLKNEKLFSCLSIIICPIEHSFKSIHTKIAYRFQATIAARGYHVNKTITWSDVKDGDLVSVEVEDDNSSKKIDPYCCAIKAMVGKDFTTTENCRTCPKRNIKAHILLFERGEREDRWVRTFHSIPTVTYSRGWFRNPLGVDI